MILKEKAIYWYKKRQKYIKKYHKQYRKKCKKKLCEYHKKYYEKNKTNMLDSKKKYLKKRRKIDISFKILENLRNRINTALKYNSKSVKTIKLLGCTIPELKQYLEKQFGKDMNWDNYGRGKNKWVIDHIKPCKNFDLSKKSEQQKCFHYKNLQPLWWYENLKKGIKNIK